MIEPYIRNRNFFGRTDTLSQLDVELLPNRSQQIYSQIGRRDLRQVAICGLGGVGKTETAIEWAYSRKSHFDAIFWVAADESSKLASGFCQIAIRLGLEDSDQPQNQVISRELVKGWLCNPTKPPVVGPAPEDTEQEDANWLLIFDNVGDLDALDDFWPVSGSGSLLITSRDPLAKTAHSVNAPSIDLEPFATIDGARFLRQLTCVTGEDSKSEEIVERLGGLPLAITQMAGIIRRQYLSFSEFLERYEDDSELPELHQLSIDHPRRTYDQTIASVWVFDTLGTAAQLILKVTSFLDPDCIPEQIYLEGASGVKISTFPRKLSSLAAARAELLQASFIKRNAEKKEIWVHRLVQDSMRAKMSTEETRFILNIAIHLVLAVWPSWDVTDKHNMKRWKKCEELYPHVLALSRAYRRLFQNNAIYPDFGFATLLNDAGWCVTEFDVLKLADF